MLWRFAATHTEPWHFPSWRIPYLKLSDLLYRQNCNVHVFGTSTHQKRDRKAVPGSVLHILSACLNQKKAGGPVFLYEHTIKKAAIQ
jgi:hypothetical protein